MLSNYQPTSDPQYQSVIPIESNLPGALSTQRRFVVLLETWQLGSLDSRQEMHIGTLIVEIALSQSVFLSL